MTPRSSAFDAIVVGGGHNGLVCAAYLARGGVRTLVLERRAQVGGMAETSELLPGVKVPTLAHTVGRLSASVARDLGLRKHGLTLIQPDVCVFAPQTDGRAITLWRDVARTAAALHEVDSLTQADAAAYARADVLVRALGGALNAVYERVPPNLASASMGNSLAAVKGALAARGRARPADASLLRTLPMSVADLTDEWFQSDALRALVAARGILLTGFGPRMPGTAQVLLTDSAGNDGGLAGQTVFARGGPGALSDALAAAAMSAGAEIRSGREVIHVRRSGESVRGVTLADGEEIDAAVVVSGLDPRTTLLTLLDPEVLGPRLRWRASNIRQRGVTAKVNFALAGLPIFPAANGDPERLRGRIVLAPSMAALETAADPAKYGEIAAQPLIEATIPSLTDPSLIDASRAGTVTHVLSAIVQAAPYDLRDGTWDERRGELADAVTRTIETYAPGFANLIEAHEVISPLDIERGYGADGGHPMHAEIGLDQWFEWRPLHGFGRYRMPLNGLYLCGSGAHPGGGITAGPGRLAAQEILSDVKAGRITGRITVGA